MVREADMGTIDEFRTWYLQRLEHLRRAERELLADVENFVQDWSDATGFRCHRQPTARIKEPERCFEKCERKGVDGDYDQLLANPFAVGDLVGVRFVVRTRADVELVIEALEQQTTLDIYGTEDLSTDPTDTGYRAFHANGTIPSKVHESVVIVPFELQVKTLAQDAWGYYTHDMIYVPTEANTHPQFTHVRALQRLISDELQVIDSLQQEIEVMADEIAHEVIGDADPAKVSFVTVQDAMREGFEVEMSVSQAYRLAKIASDAGVLTVEEFRAIVTPDSPDYEPFAEAFRASRDRSPSAQEAAVELLGRHAAGHDAVAAEA
jgi:ppGpp synthetase/RelA/SpoT-type nucleotidyltranferase